MTEHMVPGSDGEELWIDVDGPADSPVVICCHGGPGVADDLETVAFMMSERARTIRWDLVMDLPGTLRLFLGAIH